MSNITLDDMLIDIVDRTEGELDSEYARGQLELTADMFGIPGVETGIRVEQVKAMVRQKEADILAEEELRRAEERTQATHDARNKLIDAANDLINYDYTIDEMVEFLRDEFGAGY